MSNSYIDEYGRYRYSSVQNAKITVPTFQHWLDIFTNAAVSAATTTSATPVSASVSGTTDSSQGAAAGGGPDGGDVRDNADRNMSLPEYDNAKDWTDAVMSTPSLMGPAMVADGIMGRGMFDQNQDRSYSTRSGQQMNVGQPSYADIRDGKESDAYAGGVERDSGAQPGGTGPNTAGEAAAAERGSGDNDVTGSDYAEGGEVMFNSETDVPGEVEGPGGPKEDAVPANLSDGEYVNTAEAVNSFGQPFFDQVNQIAKMPGAPSLMTNPDFQKMQNDFLTNASSIAQNPATGNVPPAVGAPAPGPAGLMSPPPGGAPMPPDPMAAPMGMAEGGLVPQKGGGLMNPMEDFFDWLLERFSRNRQQAKLAPPGGMTGATLNADPAIKGPDSPKLIDDPASKAKDMGTAKEVKPEPMKGDKLSVDSVAKRTGLSLAKRAIPILGTAAATLESSPVNEGEEEALEEVKKDPQAAMGNVKEQRTRVNDSELPFVTKDEKSPSLAKKPEKKEASAKPKTKETKASENKLSPDASLGDALEFYKSQDAPGFVFKGETYERSGRSPSGYTQV